VIGNLRFRRRGNPQRLVNPSVVVKHKVERYGQADLYGRSEDKARQYSVPERADFGACIRSKGFSLK